MEHILNAKNLSIIYNNSTNYVVKNFNFNIENGETVGLFGKSGCGKSSVAWAIMGEIQKMGAKVSGEIFFCDKDILSAKNPIKPTWAELSIVAQHSMNSLNPYYIIYKTMEETLKTHRPNLSRNDCIELCDQLMEMVQLDHRTLHSRPHQLSGGMRQRVSIALAIMLNPKMLILDEATTGLDVIVEADILKLIRQIKEKIGLSILFISHDKRIQDAFCDRRFDI